MRTDLAWWREKRGVTQAELAAAIGVSRRTYQRLEEGWMGNPPIRYLVNCALALGCDWKDLVELEWEEWMPFDLLHTPEPPNPKTFWRS